MAAILTPVLLIGGERVRDIGGEIGVRPINCAKCRAQRAIEITCERDHQQGEDQAHKNEDGNEVNRAVFFGWLGRKCCHIEDLLVILILLMIFVGTIIEQRILFAFRLTFVTLAKK